MKLLGIIASLLSMGFFLLKYFLGKSAQKRKAQNAADEMAKEVERKTFEHADQAKGDAVESEKQERAAEGWTP